MQRRLTLLALATLVAACSSDSPVAPTSATTPLFAKGGGSGGSAPSAPPAPTASVAGAWTGTYRRTANPGDTTQWTLNLRQNGGNLDGGFIFMTYVDGRYSSVSVSAIKKGSVVEKSISLSFDKGEGAEVAPTFGATVSDDGQSMVGYHSRYADPITLTRR